MFTLEIPKVMSSIFNPRDISAIVDGTASGIFSVLMSFGCCAPLICAPSFSENSDLIKSICVKLESRIKNHLINTKSPLSLGNPQASPNQPRPLLLLVDRRIDLAGPLKHSASYNALIDEILGLNSNQIQIPGGKSFDIDRRDWFWQENSTKSFPQVAEAVESSLKLYKTDYDRVLQTTPGMTEDLMKAAGDSGPAQSSTLTPEQLKIAINVLPELTERKRLIDTHLHISTALLDSVKTRDLGTLFNIEQEIIIAALSAPSTSSSLSSTSILTSLKDPKMGNPQDKLRLFLIYLIYNSKETAEFSNFIKEALEILKLTGDDLKSFQSVVNIISGSSSNNNSKSNSPITTSPTTFSNNSISLSDYSSTFSDLFNRISSTTNVLVSSVKSLIPNGGISESPLTKFIDSAYSEITGGASKVQIGNNSINFIDPRPLKQTANPTTLANSSNFSIDHLIIFVIGGAAYSEYDHLLDHFSKNKTLRNLKFTFGATEILNPKKFLSQLSSEVSK